MCWCRVIFSTGYPHSQSCYLHNFDRWVSNGNFSWPFYSPMKSSSIGCSWFCMCIAVPFVPFALVPFSPLVPAVVGRISGCRLPPVASNGVISVRSRYGRTRDCLLNFATIVRALRAIISFQYITKNWYWKWERSICVIFEMEKLTGNVCKVCKNQHQSLVPHNAIVLEHANQWYHRYGIHQAISTQRPPIQSNNLEYR